MVMGIAQNCVEDASISSNDVELSVMLGRMTFSDFI
jgi:hypothetical protein